MRRGFTITELAIMTAIGLVLMGVAWNIFHAMTAQSKKLDAHLKAIMASQVVIERLKTDLAQFYFVPNYAMIEASPSRLSSSLRFKICSQYLYSATSPSQNSFLLDRVNYQFYPEEHVLRRNA